jgi:hypothetical protein
MNKNWLSICLNPQALSSLYGSSPSLDVIEIVTVQLSRDGSDMEVRCLTAQLPEKLPKKWDAKTVKKAAISFEFLDVKLISLEGWGTNPIGSLTIHKLEDGLLNVTFTSSQCTFRVSCQFVRIKSVQEVNY